MSKPKENNTELAEAYQDGDSDAGLILLNNFEAFVKKFANLLYHGDYNLHNKHINRFVSLIYAPDKTDQVYPVSQLAINPALINRKDLNAIIDTIKVKLNKYDYEDLIEELNLIMLDMARDFDPTYGVHFEYYLSNNFHYRVKNYVKTFHYTPLDISINELDESILSSPSAEENFLEDEIDENWVSGLTCGETFQQIDTEDRQILKLYYNDGLCLEEIGELYNKNASTVYRRLERIKTNIQEQHNRQVENKFIEKHYSDDETTIREIANILGLSESSIYKRLKNIKKGDNYA